MTAPMPLWLSATTSSAPSKGGAILGNAAQAKAKSCCVYERCPDKTSQTSVESFCNHCALLFQTSFWKRCVKTSTTCSFAHAARLWSPRGGKKAPCLVKLLESVRLSARIGVAPTQLWGAPTPAKLADVS